MLTYWVIGIIVFLLLNTFVFPSLFRRQVEQTDYSTFLDMIDQKNIGQVSVEDTQITFTDRSGEHVYKTGTMNDPDLVNRLREAGAVFSKPIVQEMGMLEYMLISYVIPIVLLLVVWRLISKRLMNKMGGGDSMMTFGMGGPKSNAKVYVKSVDGIKFKDVAGEEEAKELLQEIVDFLHNPGKYVKIGARLPKGALLVGPPGTGKTLLAKAVAGEANVPFFSLSGSDFVEMFVGVGASRVRDLFKQAQSMAPCIIFIDEVDAIGKSRDSHYGGGNDEREQTLNALLAEMDGFDSSKGLISLAATNRPEVLDKALLRPGRFDRRVIVERPDLKGRIETLKVHAKNVLMDDSVDFEAIALATSGAVGSDLANMINEAALGAVKDGRGVVSQKDLMEAVEVVLAGKEKKDRILSEEEKRIVAYHEVGHAVTIAVQKNSEPVQKITIVPRTMGALGYTLKVPEEERYLMSKEKLLSELVGLFGGRAAEEVVFQSVTTGASNDIQEATKIARAMVTQYGMSDTFGLMGLESIESRYLDGRPVMNCSEETGAKIDEEVKQILATAYQQALTIIREHREVMDEIAEFLIQKETITGKEFMDIFTGKNKQADRLEVQEVPVVTASTSEPVTEEPAMEQESHTGDSSDETSQL